jgi:bile acid:Na+ symporter, BASS family
MAFPDESSTKSYIYLWVFCRCFLLYPPKKTTFVIKFKRANTHPCMKKILQFITNWSLPLAMLAGIAFYRLFDKLSFITPYLIFTMLLLTFAKLTPRKVRFSTLHIWLIITQLICCIAAYSLLLPLNKIWAESALICFLAPTATSAAVVTGMLGGSVACLTTYTLVGNLFVAIAAPVLFSLIGSHSDMIFMDSFMRILAKVAPLLLLPLVAAWTMQRFTPKAHAQLIKHNNLAFYLWVVALMVVTGKTVSFLVHQENPNIGIELLIASSSLLICLFQFLFGKKIGSHYKKTISGGQALGQKNTILAIWMAQVFLSPVASLGPASYVLWQNIFNSWQLYQRRKSLIKETEE